MKNKIFIGLFFIFVAFNVAAQPLVVTTSGGPSFPSSKFKLSEAGKNFNKNVSSSSYGFMNISSGNYWDSYYSNFKWRISVFRNDIYWNQDLTLQVKKVNNGQKASNSGNINKSKNWITIKNLPTYFFKGSGAWSNIKLNFRVKNVSVLIPADDYQTTIVFTIYED